MSRYLQKKRWSWRNIASYYEQSIRYIVVHWGGGGVVWGERGGVSEGVGGREWCVIYEKFVIKLLAVSEKC